MKMYMGYDRIGGSGEGACLVFANNHKEARRLAWKTIQGWFDTEWIDISVRWLRDSEYLRSEQKSDEPHVVEGPKICECCELWGVSELDADGICGECKENREDWNE